MLEIHGVPFSVHTRKVLLTLREKQLPFELVPVIPLTPPSGWSELSPLGKIPVLRSPKLTVADSSVICQYLERRHPSPSIYPSDAARSHTHCGLKNSSTAGCRRTCCVHSCARTVAASVRGCGSSTVPRPAWPTR
jgi:hypothetical protein